MHLKTLLSGLAGVASTIRGLPCPVFFPHPTPSFFTGLLPGNLAHGVEQYPSMHEPQGKVLCNPNPVPRQLPQCCYSGTNQTGITIQMFSSLLAEQRERRKNSVMKIPVECGMNGH